MRSLLSRRCFQYIATFLVAITCTWPSLADGPPRVLPEGEVPDDARLEPLKDLNGYFPFEPPETRDAWEERAEDLRRRVLVATGLWPMPEKTALNAVIHSPVERDGFTVEKVYFESVPGHYVTGLLFRPTEKKGKRPGILCPHGHGGRHQDHGKGIAKLIEQGAEKYEGSGRFPKLARCAQLARMGCVTFTFDMLGYVDSQQISYQLAHRFAKQRPEFEGRKDWGFFSTQAEMRMQSIMGMQTWNCIRALDFLCSLPDVDAEWIGVTGGSGGGTQTIILGAIDPRPVVAFPQGMVSTAMQGGCTCENCCLLRIGTGNVELAALFAPKPQAMTAANDWTKDMMTKGYPQLLELYKLLGAEENVACYPMLEFPHNYNYVARALMYEWFNKHLELGLKSPIIENDFELFTEEELSVWTSEHPQAKEDPAYERKLIRQLDKRAQKQIDALTPSDKKSLAQYRRVVGGALKTIIGRAIPASDDITREKVDKQMHDGYMLFTDLIRLPEYGEALPVASLLSTEKDWNGRVVIWIDGRGKAGMFDEEGEPLPEIKALIADGTAVISADLLYQGEFLEDGEPVIDTRVVKNPREFAGYTFTYNHTLFAHRVHDVLTLIAFVRGHDKQPERVNLVGVNGAGPLAAAARAIAGDAVDRAAIDTEGFRFADLTSYRDPSFLPGAVKYGDLPAMLALQAPLPLFVVGEDGKLPKLVKQVYSAAGAAKNVAAAKDDSLATLVGGLSAK